MGTDKFFSHEEAYRLSRKVNDAADIADNAGDKTPETLDGGPFAYLIKDMVESSAAQHVDMVLRLRELATTIEKAGDWYKDAAEYAEETGNVLFGLTYDPTPFVLSDDPWHQQ